jgi:hypothetical protein
MATTTLTQNPQKITLPDTNENDINFDTILGKVTGGGKYGFALIDDMSAATQFNANGVTIDSSSGTFSTSAKPMIPIEYGFKLKFKGSNAATFNITIISR